MAKTSKKRSAIKMTSCQSFRKLEKSYVITWVLTVHNESKVCKNIMYTCDMEQLINRRRVFNVLEFNTLIKRE